eukprot:TRINITY_DN7722_c0_g1_i11.p1 TRINITY_DN7722_c0_g1~~TRINITY_DN7722_c0_g1_i11.p1  ORF type:complete len:670 (+),score=107.27 TRINITY_DN7722_c0_g1_i11:360-2369(+)
MKSTDLATFSEERTSLVWNRPVAKDYGTQTRIEHIMLLERQDGVLCGENSFINKIPASYLSFFFLTFLGIFVGCVSVGLDFLISKLREASVLLVGLVSNLGVQFLLYLSFTTLLLVLATSVTQFINPKAKGSGIPEMKVIMSGVWLSKYLTQSVFITKVLGIVFAQGSGAIVGKEGPLVHLAGIAEDQFSKRFFSKLRQNPAMIQQLLAAACAIGVAANWGTPFGGLLFSIEVTSTYYPIRNYYFAYVTALTGSLTYNTLWNFMNDRPLGSSFIPDIQMCQPTERVAQLTIPAVVGVVCGLIGVMIIKGYEGLINLRKKYPNFVLLQPFPYTILIAILTAVFTFSGFVGPLMSTPSRSMLKVMMSSTTNWTDTKWVSSINSRTPLEFHLGFFILTRTFLQITTMLVPIPMGIMGPSLTLGSAIGYFIGYLFSKLQTQIFAHDMAKVGAAALATAVTHKLSMPIVLLEMTGDYNILFPSMIATLVAIVICYNLTDDIFVTIMKSRKLPYLPMLVIRETVVDAESLMDPNYPVIPLENTNIENLNKILEFAKSMTSFEDGPSFVEFAIVDGNGSFCGSLPDYILADLIQNQLDQPHQELSEALVEATLEYNKLSSPFTFSPQTTLEQVHACFITLRLTSGFVTRFGKVLGTITRSKLLEICRNRKKESTFC